MGPADRNRELRDRLEALEEEAARSDERAAGLYNRAADLCRQAGDRRRALEFYGRAIDAHLSIPRPRPAAALCRKILRQAPGVVRARRTLALISIAEGYMADARRQLDDYVRAAREADEEQLAIEALRLMGRVTTDAALRSRLGEKLRLLGDDDGADRILEGGVGPVAAAPAGGLGGFDAEADEGGSRAEALRLALLGPDQLRREEDPDGGRVP